MTRVPPWRVIGTEPSPAPARKAKRAAVRHRADACRLANAGRVVSDIVTRRGRCRAKGCRSEYGLVRVTFDFAMSRERVDDFAHVECVSCGRVWYRVATPERLTARDGAPLVRFTLIVPSGEDVHLYRRNGAVHRVGDDSDVVTDATLTALLEARAAWRKRNGQLLDARARRAARKAQLEAEALARSRAVFAAADARRAEREAEEAEAAAREAANA